MTSTKSIHTVNARGNVMLEVVRDHFGIPPARMFHKIQAMRREVEDILAAKSIRHDLLKSALVPHRKRSEIAFVFDTSQIESSYGRTVFERLIPLFHPQGNHSILVGDYSGNNGDQKCTPSDQVGQIGWFEEGSVSGSS